VSYQVLISTFTQESGCLFQQDVNIRICPSQKLIYECWRKTSILILLFVAPGFEKNDFKVNVDANILTVSAEKKTEEKNDSDTAKNERQVRNEYVYRSFKRSFTIDEKIDASTIDAKYVNGVLTLNLPKKTEVKEAAKEITIQ